MKRVSLSSPHLGPDERGLLLDAFDSNWVAPLGPHVDAFEREFAARVEAQFAGALSSGTAGLHLALTMLGVGRDDEVLVSSFTFAASANPIMYCGGRPVFIDSERQTWNLDPALLEEDLAMSAKRGKLPKAVIVVDLYGQCADWQPILAACNRFEVPVVEDAAEALGATWEGKQAGNFGLVGVFSFNGNKIITTGGGGMIVSARKELIDRARFLATQARDPAPHYEHSQVGHNYRLSNLLAAVGRGQVRVLDDRIRARRAHNAWYREQLGTLPGIGFMPISTRGEWNGWLTIITVDPELFGASREDIRRALDKEDIETRPVWKPMHLQPVFKDCRVRGGAVSEAAFKTGLCLPSGSNLELDDRDRVVSVIRGLFQR